MIYNTESEHYWWFLKESQKAESKWDKRTANKYDNNSKQNKISYIDLINAN